MLRQHLPFVIVVVLGAGVAAADPDYDGPPGLSPGSDPGARLLSPTLDAPTQAEETPGLTLLRQMVHKQELHVGDSRIVIDIDGSAQITPLYGVFTIRFGFSDPYPLELRRAMESTFESRAEMSARYREAAMQFALADLPNYLEGIWAHEQWSIATRKRIFFALWDECAERGARDVVDGGRQARHVIEAFVRWKLPPRSPEAFSAAELDELNRHRTSAERFLPYRRSLRLPGRAVAMALTF